MIKLNLIQGTLKNQIDQQLNHSIKITQGIYIWPNPYLTENLRIEDILQHI